MRDTEGNRTHLRKYMVEVISRKLSYRLRVSIVMVLFAIIPFALFSVVYLKSEQTKWETSALRGYSQTLIVSSEQFARGIQEMELKILYVSNNASIRAALAQVNKMSLVESLDFVTVLRETVSSITADNENLSVRWYPYLSTKDYGAYCYTLDRFQEEFVSGDELLERIMELGNREVFTTVRKISRENNNRGILRDRVCVYTKTTNINGSDCLLEMSMPVNQMADLSGLELPEGSILGAYLSLDDSPRTLLLSGEWEVSGEQSGMSEGQQDAEGQSKAQGILAQYHETGVCTGYYPIEIQMDILPGSQVTCLFPKEYVASQVRGHMIAYLAIILLFILMVLVCIYAADTMLTVRVTRSIEKMNNELDTILEESTVMVIGDSDFMGIEKRIRKLIQNTQEYCCKLEQYEAEKNRL